MVSDDLNTQVLIVGGGPVGMGLAIELGQRGISVVVVERYEQPQPIPKGQNLTQRTMEHMHFWAAEDALRAARTIPKSYGIGGLTAYGQLLSPYHYDWLQRDLVAPYYFTTNERLPQYATEAVLRERVAALPNVQTIYGWGAQSVTTGESGVTVEIAPRKGGRTRSVQAEYLVGCDGSRSVVREAANITQTLSDHDRMMVLLVFRSTALHDLLACYPGKSYYNVLHPDLEGYWKFLGRVDLGSTWFMHAPVPFGTTADNFDFKSFLHEAVGAEFEIAFEHIGFWDLRFALADCYRSGRCFIAGDAAHSHPPYGGYGVNSGLEDARNLGWKLAARLQGWGGETLLDSYDAERRPVFDSTIRDFIAKSIEVDRSFVASCHPERDPVQFDTVWAQRATGAVGEVNAFEPNYEGSTVVVQAEQGHYVSSAVGSHQHTARVGHHLSPAKLRSGENVYERLGEGFTLLVCGDAAVADMASVVSSFGSAAAGLKLPLQVVPLNDSAEVARYAAPLILVRPDHFVAWVGDAPSLSQDSVRAILEQVSGRDNSAT